MNPLINNDDHGSEGLTVVDFVCSLSTTVMTLDHGLELGECAVSHHNFSEQCQKDLFHHVDA